MPEDLPIEQPERLFYETGASWYWLIAGPVAAVSMLLIQYKGGVGFQPWVPLIFLVLVTGFLGLQVKAARIHTSVELTRDALREGAEVIALSDIVAVFPPAQHSVKSRELLEKWQTSRALGELSGVPRGRTGIGVELAGKRTAQAWARNHRGLRAALTELVEGKTADVQ
ncbi:DUF3093 domain-containing protein [Mycobacterium sp. RTGN5]|uniref:DUF3093 domain-containing protein n=1 Tax=Mycobacterium sp. RTGN5 TaxID=3016522 RepID=UPI0029C7C4BA|nr:DUF3093 domain-containing protein [Mycobacterium sp. RTGN5]